MMSIKTCSFLLVCEDACNVVFDDDDDGEESWNELFEERPEQPQKTLHAMTAMQGWMEQCLGAGTAHLLL